MFSDHEQRFAFQEYIRERPAEPIDSNLNVVVRSVTPLGWSKSLIASLMAQTLRDLPEPNIFLQGCPLNNRKRAARTLSKIGGMYFLLLFSCLFLPRLLILFLLLLMGGNVHPNPCPMFCVRQLPLFFGAQLPLQLSPLKLSFWLHLGFSWPPQFTNTISSSPEPSSTNSSTVNNNQPLLHPPSIQLFPPFLLANLLSCLCPITNPLFNFFPISLHFQLFFHPLLPLLFTRSGFAKETQDQCFSQKWTSTATILSRIQEVL